VNKIAYGCLGIVFASCTTGQVLAETATPPDPTSYIPSVQPTRITADEAPVIDGVLDDPVWAKAAVIDEFWQVAPELAAPSEKTEMYFAYDSEALYVAIMAYDEQPEKIINRIMTRDGEVYRDDMIRFYIDPYNTGLGGFGFDVNAQGARADRIIQRGRPPIDEWDTIWDSEGQITEDGWVLEMVIPFRSISFDPENSEGWGLLITRELAHKNEEIRWSNIDPGVNKFDFRQPGRLVGIQDIEQGLGLDVELLGTVIANRDWTTTPRDNDIRLEPSANIYYKFTPSLTGLLTLNSDFSDTPLDARQVNTGRFSLFQPETRDFFLQDAAVFEFAGDTFSRSPNGRPFFSRRIGIVGGQQVDLSTGLKLSGELKGIELGVLSAKMGEGNNLDSQTLSVARASIDVLDNSRLGFIATNGDPTGNTNNSLIGSDFIYRTNGLFGGGFMQATAYFMRSLSSLGDDDSFGAKLSYPNDKWSWEVSAQQIGEDFRPALGFVNRPGVNDYNANWHRRFRTTGSWYQYWQIGSSHDVVTDLNGNLQTRKNSLNFNLDLATTDQVNLRAYEGEEVVMTPFSLPTGIIVPNGEYSANGFYAMLRSSFSRPHGTQSDITIEEYFGGERFKFKLNGSVRPSKFWNIDLTWERDDISVPNGDVTVNIYSMNSTVNFSSDISVETQAQYDNISDAFSLFSRMRWEVRPQTEVFLSAGHGAIIDYDTFPRDFESLQTQFVLRFGNRFQF
tara:strand:+ start:1568 stop:3766 length:2199 start_codon:yes stop_codon:yes gene_type:complete